MAVPVELRCLERFPSERSPLEVLVLRTHLGSLLGTDTGTGAETDPPTVLFSPPRPSGSRGPAILLRLHATTVEETPGCGGGSPGGGNTGGGSPGGGSTGGGNTGGGSTGGGSTGGGNTDVNTGIPLFASRLFLRHHRLRRLGGRGSVRPAEPVALDRLVVGVRSPRSLRGAGERLLELCGPGGGLLARRGDPLLPPGTPGDPGQPWELLVLDCSPVIQGQVTAATSLVLVDCSDWSERPPGPAPRRPPRLYASDFAQFAASLGSGRSLLDNRKLLGGGLAGVLRALECRVDARVVDHLRSPPVVGGHSGAVDADNCVFVGERLLLALGLFHGEWVRVSRPGGGAERPAAIMALETNVEDEEAALITATLWFNLTGAGEERVNTCCLRVKRWQQRQPAPGDDVHSDTSCRAASPPFASQLHVQLVMSPLYDDLGRYDDLLASHLSCPRLVVPGDVLTVPAGDQPDLLEGNTRCPALFFRVQKVVPSETAEAVVGGAYLADRRRTSLYMAAACGGGVPWVSGGERRACALEQPVEQLSGVLRPHMGPGGGALAPCSVLLHGPPGSGKVTAVAAVTRRLHLHLVKVDCVSVCGDTAAATEAKMAAAFQRAAGLRPCVLLLRNLQHLLRPAGGAHQDGRVMAALRLLLSSAPHRVAVVATVCRPRQLPAAIMAAFVHQVALEAPDLRRRSSVLRGLAADLPLGGDVDLDSLATLTAGLVLKDLKTLMVQAGRTACRRLRSTRGGQEVDLCSSGVTIQNRDFTSALEKMQDMRAVAVGSPKIPQVSWEDVGGLHQVKKEILDTVQLPLQRPELLARGLARTGLLLYGPPGTGKTLLAKAVATECSMTFLSVKGPELINMYVGQSEENIREVFSRSVSAAPCIVFFDELDSLAPSRGRSGDSGGVTDRLVSQLLSELDSLSPSSRVFVIGATNRPDLLDPSLLRPGRLDKLIYVGVSEDRDAQLQVLGAITRKFRLGEDVDLRRVLDLCPAHMSGADLYAVCSDAMMAAVKRKISLVQRGLDRPDAPPCLLAEDFAAALRTFRPSVSQQELQRFEELRGKGS